MESTAVATPRKQLTPAQIVGTAVFVVILLVAAWLRLRVLAHKPLHSDEGVNGWFLMNLYEGLAKWNMRYKYDPTNYHGPFLYFAGLVPFLTLGPSNVTLRLLPALAGIACVGVLWPVRRWLGWAGLATAAVLLALSPPFVYFSRTAIHEIYVIFFSLLAVVCFVRSFTGTGPSDGPRYRSNWLLGAFVSAALVFTNKETAVITFTAFGVASVVSWFLCAGRGSWPKRFRELLGLRPRGKDEWNDWGLAFAWAAAVTIILFTSFFNHPRGAWDMFATYGTWVGRGHEGAGHDKPFRYWIDLMWGFDAPIFLLGIAGTLAALWRRDRFSLFVASWTWFLWLVYSLIAYKTPWLNLNFTGPMCLLGGIAVRELAVLLRARAAEVALAVAAPVVIAAWPVPAGPVISAEREGTKLVTWSELMWDVNFLHSDDDRYAIIYVQTVRDFEAMVSRLDALFAAHGPKLAVWVTSGDYWPLPFYMRDFDSLGYHQGKIPAGTPPAVVVASSTQEAELRARLYGYRQEQFMLRPGVVLTMSAEPAIWDPVFGAPDAVAAPAPPPEDPGLLVPGLVAEYRYGIGCTGEVLERRVDPKPVYGGHQREFRAPVCATWRGFVKLEEEGEYAFGTSSDDGSWVWVGGELAIDNGGTHGPVPRTGVLRTLKAGLHPIEVKYFDAGGGAMLEVFAKKRGGVDVPLDGKLVHDKRAATATAATDPSIPTPAAP